MPTPLRRFADILQRDYWGKIEGYWFRYAADADDGLLDIEAEFSPEEAEQIRALLEAWQAAHSSS
jgi:hypothetical protein